MSIPYLELMWGQKGLLFG